MQIVSRPLAALSILVSIIVTLSLIAIVPTRAQSPAENAQVFVQGLSDQATALISDPGLAAEAGGAISRLLNDYFASSAIGKWVLGRYGGRPQKRKEKNISNCRRLHCLRSREEVRRLFGRTTESNSSSIQQRKIYNGFFPSSLGRTAPVRLTLIGGWHLKAKDF